MKISNNKIKRQELLARAQKYGWNHSYTEALAIELGEWYSTHQEEKFDYKVFKKNCKIMSKNCIKNKKILL